MSALRYLKILSVAATATFAIAASSGAVAADRFVTIGTGGVTGVYYPTGGAICRLVNRKRKNHGIRCSVESTQGSIYNLNSLRQGGMDLAVAQSDAHYHALKGTGHPNFIKNGPFSELRSVFSLHSEAFTVVVRKNSGINKFDDILGKRVNIGDTGSGSRATLEALMYHKGWKKSDFRVASELRGQEQAQALCDNKIDVMIYNLGHPNGAVQEVATTCDVKIIPVDGPVVRKLVQSSPYYAFTEIPGGMYPGSPHNVKTFGVKATFVTTSKVDEEVIYQVVKNVFDNFSNFKTLHPVFSTLNEKRLAMEGNSAPLHRGAARYFRERGWLRR